MEPIIIALCIPIIALLAKTAQDITRMVLDHQQKGSPRADSMELKKLRMRMEEMENRILTLQDLVISGDYETRRKLEIAQIERPSAEDSLSSAPETSAARTLASTDSGG